MKKIKVKDFSGFGIAKDSKIKFKRDKKDRTLK